MIFGSDRVAMKLEEGQALAIGPFNPHIITPEWLVKYGVCRDEEVEMRFAAMSRGTEFNFNNLTWQVDGQRLSVGSNVENCGDYSAKVIELLHHTPVRAVGNNFHYSCAKDQWGDSPLPMIGTLGREDLTTFGTVEQTRWMGLFSCQPPQVKSEARVEVMVALGHTGVVVLFNFHREMKSTEEAQAAARMFEDDLQVSRTMLQSLFNQQVTS